MSGLVNKMTRKNLPDTMLPAMLEAPEFWKLHNGDRTRRTSELLLSAHHDDEAPRAE